MAARIRGGRGGAWRSVPGMASHHLLTRAALTLSVGRSASWMVTGARGGGGCTRFVGDKLAE